MKTIHFIPLAILLIFCMMEGSYAQCDFGYQCSVNYTLRLDRGEKWRAIFNLSSASSWFYPLTITASLTSSEGDNFRLFILDWMNCEIVWNGGTGQCMNPGCENTRSVNTWPPYVTSTPSIASPNPYHTYCAGVANANLLMTGYYTLSVDLSVSNRIFFLARNMPANWIRRSDSPTGCSFDDLGSSMRWISMNGDWTTFQDAENRRGNWYLRWNGFPTNGLIASGTAYMKNNVEWSFRMIGDNAMTLSRRSPIACQVTYVGQTNLLNSRSVSVDHMTEGDVFNPKNK